MADIVNFSTRELDYDDIVANLREFMRYQTEFSDYDFTGSALSTLISTLAYNTHYNGVYDNFAVNESFLDSAVKRSSVISHANLVNYTPRSAKAATARINITVRDNDSLATDKVFTLPRGSSFTSVIDDTTYNFVSTSVLTFSKSLSGYTLKDVELQQGNTVVTRHVYNGSNDQKFVIGDTNIDISTLAVRVIHEDEAPTTFVRADDIMSIDNTSRVYFLTMNGNGYYQIQFGSGMMGFSLSARDEIEISYLTTSGQAANGARVFNYVDTLSALGFSGAASIQIVCTGKSAGGCYPEDTESIRKLAPRVYSTQNRCVTESDYQNIIRSQYGNAKSVKVWGGEKNDPPQYGKVFISVVPQGGGILSNIEKQNIMNIVNQRKIIGSGDVEMVDPSILNIHVTSTIYYDPRKSINTVQDIETIARNAILQYSDDHLGDFNNILKFSNLVHAIDMCDGGRSVQNNNTRIKLSSTIAPQFNVLKEYQLKFNNTIYRPKVSNECVMSNGFYCTAVRDRVCYIDDDPALGVLRLFYIDDDHRKVIVQSIGSVDYINGILTIDKLNVTSLVDQDWRFTIDPASNDVVTRNNQFAVISNDDLVINAISVASDSSYVQVSSK